MQNLMLYPMFALFALTCAVFVALFRARAGSVARGEIKASHFLIYATDQREADGTLALSRHFANLFETPVLFYVACLAIMLYNGANLTLACIAWGYVLMRVLHAFIHTGSNNLRWRILVYFGSWFFLAALWIGLLWVAVNN